MKVAYIPVLKTAANYGTNIGRRWSVLEHMLLLDLTTARRTVNDLVASTNLRPRLVVEALINLVRANFIEIRASEADLLFQATGLGKRQAANQEIEANQTPSERWISLAFDQVTGTWLRSEDMALVHEHDLPQRAHCLPVTYSTYDPSDGRLRDLLHLAPDETLRQEEIRLRKPAKPFARIAMRHGVLEGLPPYAGEDLKQRVREFLSQFEEEDDEDGSFDDAVDGTEFSTDLSAEDVYAGGPDQLNLLREALRSAGSTVVIHSCFVSQSTIRKLLPDLEAAAKRKVRVDLLWGLDRLHEGDVPTKISDADAVLNELSPALRKRVQLSLRSSGSHAKVIVYDDAATGAWISAIGSCNFLSTNFDAVDVALKLRSPGVAVRLLSWLLTMQIPTAGAWPAVARRLDRAWTNARRAEIVGAESGKHGLQLVIDADHYAMVRLARDSAERDIVVACDLLGVAAETSAFVPLGEAAAHGTRVSLFYQRPSDTLADEGRLPKPDEMSARGLPLETIEELHAKLLAWDDNDFVLTSFNWLSTSVDRARARGAEIGVHVIGEGPRSWVASKLADGPLKSALESHSPGRGPGRANPAKC
ncbi:MAG: phosphatidylserine synthase [Pseudomonadota bacterium]